MADFQYSEAIKGAEAIVAQLKMKYEGASEDVDPNFINGYKSAYWDALHALGMMKYHEKFAKPDQTL